MNASEHSSNLGKLVHNFQALETWLRFVLLKFEPSQHATAQLEFEGMPLGTELATNEVTDYADLKTLCKRFNRHMADQGAPLLNLAIVDIRDAIAHGRIIGTTQGFPPRLVKFTRPVSGKVKLVVNEVMDQNWFALQLFRTHRAIERVRSEA